MKTMISLMTILFAATVALADGMAVAPYQYEVWETDQLAVIEHADGVETLSILPVFEGDVTAFAWVVPTPAVPEVTVCPDGLFTEAAQLSMPVYRHRDGFWGCSETDYLVGATDGRDDEVVIHSHEIVGIYDVTVLGAENAAALADSLTAWGYLHPGNVDDVLPLLEDYVDEGWSFSVMRIDEDAFLEWESSWWYGGIQPLTFAFASESVVYPMRISAAGSAETCDVILYTITDHRLTYDGAATVYANRITGGELAAIREQYPTLGARLAEGDFVTKLRRVFTPEEMEEDLVLEEAGADAEFRQVYYSGVPVTLGLLAAVGFGVRFYSSRRRRSG